MRRFVFVLCLALLLVIGPACGLALAAPGALDTSFGTNGYDIVDLGTGTDQVVQSALEPDGSILVICDHTDGTTSTYYLLHYSASGQLDTAFGGSGSVVLPIQDPNSGASQNWAQHHVLFTQPTTGRILVMANDEVLAYTSEGLPDTSFATGGVLTAPAPPSGRTWGITQYEMAPDGSLVAVGYTYTASSSEDVVVMRFTADGALDASFANGGILVQDLVNRSADYPTSAIVDDAGRVIVAGTIEGSDGFLLRLLPDGTLDASFGDSGLLVPGTPNPIYEMVELADGQFMCALGGGAGGSASTLTLLNADGSVDTAHTNIGLVNNGAPATYAVLSDGTVITAGTVDDGYPTYYDFVIKRYTPDGTPDETFAANGTVTIDFGASDDSGTAIVRPDGRIIVAGSATTTTAAGPRSSASRAATDATAGQRGIIFQLLGGERLVDTTAPNVTATGVASGAWLRRSVTITLTATDDSGGSGVASISYTLDGVLHTVTAASTQVSVPASPNAKHVLSYWAIDLAGNVSAAKMLTFHVDTVGPTTAGKAAAGHKAHRMRLYYRVRDNLSPKATAVILKVRNRRGKVIKTFRLGTKTTATWHYVKWMPRARGTYHYAVYAHDLAGNKQVKVGTAKVVVR